MFNKIVYQFSSTAAKQGFDNRADSETIKHILELDRFLDLAYVSWRKYCALNGIPELKFKMVSGYRCEDLNNYLNASPKSAHLKGYAADITITEKLYFQDFYIWASEFARICADKNILYDEIILERVNSVYWIHFSIRDYDNNQYMKALNVNKDYPTKIKSVVYGDMPKISKTEQNLTENYLTSSPMENQLNEHPTNLEIEGVHGDNEMDLDIMPGTYMRCIYIMKRLMTSFSFTVEQSAGIVGNLLKETEGRLGTTKNEQSYVGICQWAPDKQLSFRRMFLNENRIETANLCDQTSFLIKEIASKRLYEKIGKMKNSNDVCTFFYKKYIKEGIYLNLTDLNIKQECSQRRAFTNAAIEIYNNYINDYQDDWLVGYYEGDGVSDGPSIKKTNDTKLWNSQYENKPLNLNALDAEMEYFSAMLADIPDIANGEEENEEF